jgi:hypothetical protein
MEQNIVNSIVLESLKGLKRIKRKEISFPKLLSKCNPYELVVNCQTVESLVDFIMGSHKQTSSQTIWGNYLESIAVKVCEKNLNGIKSKEECTDIEWFCDGVKHFRGWKSSPKWCNADQKSVVNLKETELKNTEDFGSYKVLTSYGKTTKRITTNSFVQLSGQEAWEEISNDNELYNKIMVGIELNRNIIVQFIESIYISDRERIIPWMEDNFLNDNNTINFIKINKYVSSRDNITITEW